VFTKLWFRGSHTDVEFLLKTPLNVFEILKNSFSKKGFSKKKKEIEPLRITCFIHQVLYLNKFKRLGLGGKTLFSCL